jgi:hypothetical protein
MPEPIADDITVTTATRSEDEVRSSLGGDTEKPPAAAAAAVSLTPEQQVEQEAESPQPDQSVSEAARTMRANRKAERKARLQDEITTYEESIQALGGVVPTLEKRAYKDVQEELDHLTRRRFELSKVNVDLLKKAKKPQTAADPPKPVAPQGAAAAATAKPAFEFKFPTWDEWQAQHPDDEYTTYVDARNDAREEAKGAHKAAVDTWERGEADRRRTASEAARSEAEAPLLTQYDSAVADFKAQHTDYDEVTSKVSLDHLFAQTMRNAQGDVVSNKALVVRQRLLQDPSTAPSILYYLGQHPEHVERIAQATGLASLMEVLGEVRYAAKVASSAAPAPAGGASAAVPAAPAPAAAVAAPVAPSKPKPGAPAPLAPVSGGSPHSRTPAQLAEDTEDADAYIDARMSSQPRGPRR